MKVYQFMAHKNANVNIALMDASKADSEIMKVIAMESKKDAAAMKTIAILGMVFLPGAFLAVCTLLSTFPPLSLTWE